MNCNIMSEQQPTTDDRAIRSLNYTDTYYLIAITHYKLSRQQGLSIEDSLVSTHLKIKEICTGIIEQVNA